MSNSEAKSTDRQLRFLRARVICEPRTDGSLLLRTETPLAPSTALIHDQLKHWATTRPDAVFLAERDGERPGWQTASYADVYRQASRLSAALVSRELGPDRPILILSGNDIAHQIVAFAAMMAGIPYTPLSVAYSTTSQDLGKLRGVLKVLDPGLVFASRGEAFQRALTIDAMAGREIVVGDAHAGIPGALALDEVIDGVAIDHRNAVRIAQRAVNPRKVARRRRRTA